MKHVNLVASHTGPSPRPAHRSAPTADATFGSMVDDLKSRPMKTSSPSGVLGDAAPSRSDSDEDESAGDKTREKTAPARSDALAALLGLSCTPSAQAGGPPTGSAAASEWVPDTLTKSSEEAGSQAAANGLASEGDAASGAPVLGASAAQPHGSEAGISPGSSPDAVGTGSAMQPQLAIDQTTDPTVSARGRAPTPASSKPLSPARAPGQGSGSTAVTTASDDPSDQKTKQAGATGTSETSVSPSTAPEAQKTASSFDPPPAAPPPADQVVAGLRTLGLASAGGDAGPASAATPTAAPSTSNDAGGVPGSLKTLTINLAPDHLGPVAITLRMTATGLDIKIAVATHEALQLLERDRHKITAVVEAAGVKGSHLGLGGAAAITVQGSPEASSVSLPAAGPNGQNDSTSLASADGRHRDDKQSSRSAAPSEPDTHDDAAPLAPLRRRSLDGSLYL